MYTVPAGKSEGRGLLGRSGCVCEDNIKMDLKEME
jgi:hypothetical protein